MIQDKIMLLFLEQKLMLSRLGLGQERVKKYLSISWIRYLIFLGLRIRHSGGITIFFAHILTPKLPSSRKRKNLCEKPLFLNLWVFVLNMEWKKWPQQKYVIFWIVSIFLRFLGLYVLIWMKDWSNPLCIVRFSKQGPMQICVIKYLIDLRF